METAWPAPPPAGGDAAPGGAAWAGARGGDGGGWGGLGQRAEACKDRKALGSGCHPSAAQKRKIGFGRDRGTPAPPLRTDGGVRQPGPAHGAEPCAVTTGPAHEPCGDTTSGAAARGGLERRGQRCGGGLVVPGVGPRLTASSGAQSAGGAGSGPAASPGRGEEAVRSLAHLLSRQW